MKARVLIVMMAASGFFGAAGSSVAGDVKMPTPLTDAQMEKARAPILLTDTQMEKVVAGKYTLNTDPANSPNSCNSGKCNFDNPQGNEIGKPVTGFNN